MELKQYVIRCRVCGQENPFIGASDTDVLQFKGSCAEGHRDWEQRQTTWEWPESAHTHPLNPDGSLDFRTVVPR